MSQINARFQSVDGDLGKVGLATLGDTHKAIAFFNSDSDRDNRSYQVPLGPHAACFWLSFLLNPLNPPRLTRRKTLSKTAYTIPLKRSPQNSREIFQDL